jgi:N-acyl homoserine lactone hydrolase
MATPQTRLYMFQTGVIDCTLQSIKMNQGMNEPFVSPIPFFLIQHPKGNIVIDGGMPVECATDPKAYWGPIVDVYKPRISTDEGCVAQLEKIGLSATDINYVIFSHLHLDHTGACGRFPNAYHFVQRREYEYAYTPDWFSAAAYIRKDFDRPGLKWILLEGEQTDFYDLFDDGAITLIFTPGHSPGHQSILVKLANRKPILLTVDAAYTSDHWNEKALPGFLTSATEVVRSVRKLHEVARKADAMVVTGHDPDEWPKFKKAPEYYD